MNQPQPPTPRPAIQPIGIRETEKGFAIYYVPEDEAQAIELEKTIGAAPVGQVYIVEIEDKSKGRGDKDD